MTNEPIKIALAGLGTVGIGVLKILEKNKNLLNNKTGRNLEIHAVCAKSKSKPRAVDLTGIRWVDDPLNLAEIKDIDIIIEVIGGSADPSKSLIEKALQCGKHVVTANKALLATHGHALALMAEKNNVALRFEASVAGGIPIIKAFL